MTESVTPRGDLKLNVKRDAYEFDCAWYNDQVSAATLESALRTPKSSRSGAAGVTRLYV